MIAFENVDRDNYESVDVGFNREEILHIEDYADEQGVSLSEFIRRVVLHQTGYGAESIENIEGE